MSAASNGAAILARDRLLDTDILIELLRGKPEAESWLAHLASPPFVSGVSVLEAAYGARDTAELRLVHEFAAELAIVWPEALDFQTAAQQYARYRLSSGLGSLDAISAAVALRLGLTLATFNRKHFASVPGLLIEVPYSR